MVRDINIYLEPNSNGTLVYHPGHVLKGMVEYQLDRAANIHCFYVTVIGKAEAHWDKEESVSYSSGDTRTVEYYTAHQFGSEFFINEEIYFIGSKKGPLITLQPGIYKFNFSCKLPQNLPNTFNSKLGDISYCVESNIDHENRYKICFGHIPFEVVRFDNFNLYPELRLPIKIEKVKSFCSIFCTGSLIVTITLPYAGCAVGQSVPIKIDYRNKSNVDVKQSNVNLTRLIQYTCLHLKTETKKDRHIVMNITDQGVKARSSNSFDVILEIPKGLICSNDKYCKLVTITYSIDVDVELGALHANMKIHIPIFIGNFYDSPDL